MVPVLAAPADPALAFNPVRDWGRTYKGVRGHRRVLRMERRAQAERELS